MSDSKVKVERDRKTGKDVYRVGDLPMEAKTQADLDEQVAEQKRKQAQKPVGGGLAAAAAKNKARMNPVSEALRKTSEKK